MRAQVIAVAIAGALLAVPSSLTQEQSCTASVLVSVFDETSSLPIEGLVRENFHAKVHGQELPILSVSRAPAQRRVVFVIDRSGSMTSATESGYIKRILDDAISAIPNSGSIAFLAFSGQFSKQVDFAQGRPPGHTISDLLRWEPTGKGNKLRTPLWDNIDAALHMLNPPWEGDVIVVISDGNDNMSKLSEGDIRKELLASGVPLFAVILARPHAATPEERTAPALLRDLADATGGLTAVGDPQPIHPGVLIRLLALQYELRVGAPYLEKPEKWKIEVTPANPAEKTRLVYPRYLPPCEAKPWRQVPTY